jgi:tetratricopeptide (TPR) repeat protein
MPRSKKNRKKTKQKNKKSALRPANLSSRAEPTSSHDSRSMEDVLRNLTKLVDEFGVDELTEGGFLADPDLLNKKLKEMEGESLKLTPLQEAQKLMNMAFQTSSRKERIWLARDALEICEDCVDAYVVLAEEEHQDIEEVRNLYQAGVAAGRRTLGEEFFKENKGYFWGVVETRPFMRALTGLAHANYIIGEYESAIANLQEMLLLNSSDNQGVRYILLHWLIRARKFADARSLLKQFPEELTAAWKYGEALLLFAQNGNVSQAKKVLKQAIDSNKYVADYLLLVRDPPKMLSDSFSFGSESEAASYVMRWSSVWDDINGACKWLRDSYLSAEDIERINKRSAAMSVIEDLPVEDLVVLNDEICKRIDYLMEQEIKEQKRNFAVGDQVTFLSQKGEQVAGAIKKLNKKTATVITPQCKEWKVSFGLLQKISNTSLYTESECSVIDFKSRKRLH